MFAREATIGLLLAGFGAAPAVAQETPPEAIAERDVQALIQELGHDSYRVRMKAEKELRALGEKAVEALKTAAEGADDPEVQWRARRLLRQTEAGDEGGLRRRPDAAPDRPRTRWNQNRPRTGFPDLDETFERLFQDLERDFGMDIPRRRFFQDDFFQDLEQQMQDMRARMQQMHQGLQGAQGRSMSMQMGPDGVRVEVKTKNEDGEEETKVYEAPDLETFREKYPGVLQDQGLGGFRFRVGQPDLVWPRRLPPVADRFPPPQIAPPVAALPQLPPPEGRRLGVLVREDGDAGLYVEEVQDDTLAERLGLQVGDVVTKIGDTGIHSVNDVQKALGAIEAGQTVRVEVERDGETVVLEAEKKVSAPKRDGTLRGR